MSHSYFISDLPLGCSLEELMPSVFRELVTLSNTHHHDLQEALEWDKREFKAKDGSGDIVYMLWETTVHDTKPIGVDGEEFLTQLDEHYDAVLAAIGLEPIGWLYDLATKAHERGKFIYIF